jgi:hypothetical protein
MQTIKTKFLSPTDTKPARVKAITTSGIKMLLSWDHGCDTYENHVAAAKALAEKLKWTGQWHGGSADDGEMIFVCICGLPVFEVAK